MTLYDFLNEDLGRVTVAEGPTGEPQLSAVLPNRGLAGRRTHQAVQSAVTVILLQRLQALEARVAELESGTTAKKKQRTAVNV